MEIAYIRLTQKDKLLSTMKRDWDLVREILFAVEDLPPEATDGLRVSALEAYPPQLVAYHIEMLHQAGLLNAIVEKTSAGTAATANSLTWEGHEFLDSIRQDSIWEKIKGSFTKGQLSLPKSLIEKFGTELLAETVSQYIL